MNRSRIPFDKYFLPAKILLEPKARSLHHTGMGMTPEQNRAELAKHAASLSNEKLVEHCETALRDIADDLPYLKELRERFRCAKGEAICGYEGWIAFVEKNSRYDIRTIQRLLQDPLKKKPTPTEKIRPQKNQLELFAQKGVEVCEHLANGDIEKAHKLALRVVDAAITSGFQVEMRDTPPMTPMNIANELRLADGMAALILENDLEQAREHARIYLGQRRKEFAATFTNTKADATNVVSDGVVTKKPEQPKKVAARLMKQVAELVGTSARVEGMGYKNPKPIDNRNDHSYRFSVRIPKHVKMNQ